MFNLKTFSRLLALCLLVSTLGLPLSQVQAGAESQTRPIDSRQTGAVPRFEAGACPEEILSRVPPGDTVECGALVVPEKYAEPDGATIRLDVVIIPAVTGSKAPDPVVFAQGGPGGSTIDYYTQVLFTSRIRANRDFVLFDQRGTHYAQPNLFCQEIFDEGIRTLPLDLSPEESDRQFNEAALACRKRLVDEGVDLSAYNSVENAKDIESLRQALGYRQINLYGVSYGTLLALHAMREEPQALRSVVLDSVVPTTIDFNFDAPNSQDRAFTEFFNACRNDAGCNAAYPDLETRFFSLVDRLSEKPVMLRVEDSETGKSYQTLMNGDSLVGTLFQMLYVTEFIPMLPKVIANLEAGRYAFVEQVLGMIIFDRTMSYGMYFSVVCAEDGASDPGYSYDGIREQFSENVAEENASTVALCQAWDVAQLGPAADEAVVSDIPTLVFNGRFDPITPPAYGEEAAKTLSRSTVVTFPNTGHGALTSSACADSIFLEFLSRPEGAPDTSCVADLPPVKFLTDQDVIDLPLMLPLAMLKGAIVWKGSLFLLGVGLMLSALVVFPLLWLIRKLRNKAGRPTPGLAHLAPWLPVMNGGVLLILGGALFAVVVLMVTQEETSALYFGIPSQYGALLALGFFSLLLTLGMVGFTAAGWGGRYWSIGRKVYYTLLTAGALGCSVLMAGWGLFTFWM